jgi:hypothetical protein
MFQSKYDEAVPSEILRAASLRIVYCQHVGESGEKLFQTADQLGLEGIIGKRATSRRFLPRHSAPFGFVLVLRCSDRLPTTT